MPIINGFEVLNLETEDYHAHTLNFSDGFNTVDEMVIHAGKIGMTKLVLTDHSQAVYRNGRSMSHRILASRWENIHNEVEVHFGVEGDILNDNGDVCFDIQGVEPKHIILSAHPNVYTGDPKKITQAYLNAIERFGDKITFIGHLCAKYFDKTIDVEPIIDLALKMDIPLELNGGNLANNKTNMANLSKLLSMAKKLYINSDAHTLNELSNNRIKAFKFLCKYTKQN